MNLLTDDWIPVRPQQSGAARQINLQTLLCGGERWELTLPRDDMELAALQLLICIVQVLLPPADKKDWAERIAKPLSSETLDTAARDYQEWFQLNHKDYPFMQVKNVTATERTSLDKLFTGLDTSTNSQFVNEPNLAENLCPSCVSIALFNYASTSPSFGGGFKYGIRSTCAVTTFARGQDLLSTIWLNILTQDSLDEYNPGWKKIVCQPPTWVELVKEKSTIPAHKIGLLRGLLWQPGHIELNDSVKSGACSCCGQVSEKLYSNFNKAKFDYRIEGFWEHPHSPYSFTVKDGGRKIEYLRFSHAAPAWTQLSSYIVKKDISDDKGNEQGQRPAMVIRQLKKYLPGNADKLELLIGAYRNKSAKILERRHELLMLNRGWETNSIIVHELVEHALKYKTALRNSLFTCSRKNKKNNPRLKITGLPLHEIGETQFYRRSEDLMMRSLADIDFNNTLPTYLELDKQLKHICESIFTELTSPYEHDLELFRTLAIARRSLQKDMKDVRIHELDEDAA